MDYGCSLRCFSGVLRDIKVASLSLLSRSAFVLSGECVEFVIRCVVDDVMLSRFFLLAWVSILADAAPTLSSKRYPDIRGLSDLNLCVIVETLSCQRGSATAVVPRAPLGPRQGRSSDHESAFDFACDIIGCGPSGRRSRYPSVYREPN